MVSPTGLPMQVASRLPDAFDPLEIFHRQTLMALGELPAWVTHLLKAGCDLQARELSREVVEHFSVLARQHHQDEEGYVFPRFSPAQNEHPAREACAE